MIHPVPPSYAKNWFKLPARQCGAIIAKKKFGVIAFPCGIRPPEAFAHSHKPICSLDDFKGFKLRTVGAWCQIFLDSGAAATFDDILDMTKLPSLVLI